MSLLSTIVVRKNLVSEEKNEKKTTLAAAIIVKPKKGPKGLFFEAWGARTYPLSRQGWTRLLALATKARNRVCARMAQ